MMVMSDEQMDSYFRNLDELFNLRQKNESLKKENSLLKRQLEEIVPLFTPIPPEEDYAKNGRTIYKCDRCGRRLRGRFGARDKRCQNCGQVVNWSDVI